MVKKLSTLAYMCSLLMGLMVVINVIESFSNSNDAIFSSRLLMSLLWIFPCFMQFFYTYKTASVIGLAEYKPTESLDDYAMNDMELTDEIVQNGFWLKGFATINSIVLCFYFLNVFSSLLNYISSLFDSRPWFEKIYLFVSILLALFVLPTVLYNLRTFNISRVRREAE